MVAETVLDSFFVWIDYFHDICSKGFASILCKLCETIYKVIIFYATWHKPIRLWRICHNIIICVVGKISLWLKFGGHTFW